MKIGSENTLAHLSAAKSTFGFGSNINNWFHCIGRSLGGAARHLRPFCEWIRPINKRPAAVSVRRMQWFIALHNSLIWKRENVYATAQSSALSAFRPPYRALLTRIETNTSSVMRVTGENAKREKKTNCKSYAPSYSRFNCSACEMRQRIDEPLHTCRAHF